MKGKKMGKRSVFKIQEYHFFSMLLGIIVVLLLVFGILNLLKGTSNSDFTIAKLLDFVGIFFSVTGAVTALFFIIMGVYVYRTQRGLENSIEKMEKTDLTIDRWNKNYNDRELSYYNMSYLFYSDMIEFHENSANLCNLELKRIIKRNCNETYDECKNCVIEDIVILQGIIKNHKIKRSYYKLQQARLACYFKNVDGKTRVSMIRLLGNIRRDDIDKKEIEKDIRLLKNIIYHDTEYDRDVLEAAKKALKELYEKL